MSYNTIDWPSLYFAAEAQQDVFEDVVIVTARSECVNLTYQAAAEVMVNQQLSHSHVHAIAEMLITQQKVHVQEFVRVDEDGIVVCLDVIDVEDEYVAWRALEMVARALDQLNSGHGTVYFGEPLYFSIGDVSSIISTITQPIVPGPSASQDGRLSPTH